MGGKIQAVAKDNKVTGFEVTFRNQDPNFAPALEESKEKDIKFSIVGRDRLLPLIKMQLADAFSYLQGYFDIELLIDEIEAKYIGENKEEDLIKLRVLNLEEKGGHSRYRTIYLLGP